MHLTNSLCLLLNFLTSEPFTLGETRWVRVFIVLKHCNVGFSSVIFSIKVEWVALLFNKSQVRIITWRPGFAFEVLWFLTSPISGLYVIRARLMLPHPFQFISY
jgi:hypothetical protein